MLLHGSTRSALRSAAGSRNSPGCSSRSDGATSSGVIDRPSHVPDCPAGDFASGSACDPWSESSLVPSGLSPWELGPSPDSASLAGCREDLAVEALQKGDRKTELTRASDNDDTMDDMVVGLSKVKGLPWPLHHLGTICEGPAFWASHPEQMLRGLRTGGSFRHISASCVKTCRSQQNIWKLAEITVPGMGNLKGPYFNLSHNAGTGIIAVEGQPPYYTSASPTVAESSLPQASA